jgi:hypothetical protein
LKRYVISRVSLGKLASVISYADSGEGSDVVVDCDVDVGVDIFWVAFIYFRFP